MLIDLPQVAQAVVTTFEPSGRREIVAYYASSRGGAAASEISQTLRAAARLHGAGLSRTARGHPDDVEQQGRPQEPAQPKGPRFSAGSELSRRQQTESAVAGRSPG